MDKQLQLQKRREYYNLNKDKINQYRRQFRKDNNELVNQKQRDYRKTEIGRRSYRIDKWLSRGIIADDIMKVYEIYKNATHCDYCNTEFENEFYRCLDHSHHITDAPNIRAILCRSCNVKDVLKDIDINTIQTSFSNTTSD